MRKMPPEDPSITVKAESHLKPPLPSAYLRRMEGLLGDEYPAFLDIYTQPPSAGLRVNTLKISSQVFLQSSPFRLETLPWEPDGFRLLPEETTPQSVHAQPGKHSLHAAGLYYLQDPSAMAVVELLDPQPGEKVLDLSAAPGGKSTQIACRMQNQGLLVANELHPKRVWDLAENLERWGARHTAVLNEEPARLADHFGAFFDRVLVDAPCSGEGMFRKSQSARSAWSEHLVQSCAVRQLNILNQAARLVCPGGLLVYSTCTFAPEEDELLIARFLDSHARYASPAFEVIETQPRRGFSPGRPEWIEHPAYAALAAQLRQAVRLWPHLGAPEGHFAALLRRTDEAPPSSLKPYRTHLPPAALQCWQAFCQENLADPSPTSLQPHLTLDGSYLYAVTSLLPSLGKLRGIHPGWWLGQVKGERFEPSHALAMGIQAEHAQRQVPLNPDSSACSAFLHGESLPVAGEAGWVLVTVLVEGEKSAFPLGWGKRSGGIVKNKLPRGLRWT
jgi:16S rRNA C967 or C1407 C5-methylase (RsmB/RsmF family)/NOL1/NOP2/fmu family ribosome biogenesis protein